MGSNPLQKHLEGKTYSLLSNQDTQFLLQQFLNFNYTRQEKANKKLRIKMVMRDDNVKRIEGENSTYHTSQCCQKVSLCHSSMYQSVNCPINEFIR